MNTLDKADPRRFYAKKRKPYRPKIKTVKAWGVFATPRCDKLKAKLPIYTDCGPFKVITDDAEHWEKLARKLERELNR